MGFSYQNGGGSQNLTGSPDYGARIRVVGDPGAGCSKRTYRQFNTAAFQGPLINSVGLESGNNYLHGLLQSALDLAIARNIRLGGGRQIQLRVDMFNAPNQAIITGRATTITLASPADPITNVAPAFDPVTGLLNNGVNLTSTGARQPEPFAAEERGLRRRKRLSSGEDDPGTDQVLVLARRSVRQEADEGNLVRFHFVPCE